MFTWMLLFPFPQSRRWSHYELWLNNHQCGPLIPALSGNKFDTTVERFWACGAVVAANTTSVAQTAQDNSPSRSDVSALSWETHPHTPTAHPRHTHGFCHMTPAPPLAPCSPMSMARIPPTEWNSFWACHGWHFNSCIGNTRSGRICFILHAV